MKRWGEGLTLTNNSRRLLVALVWAVALALVVGLLGGWIVNKAVGAERVHGAGSCHRAPVCDLAR